MAEETKSTAGRIALGALAAVVIAVAVLVFLPQEQPGESVTQATPAPAVDITPSDATETAEAPAPPPPAPMFDTFRVEPDGSMVVAGRAEPGQVVDIILSGEAIERVTADASGSFVALPQAGPSDQPRTLTLLADPDGAAISSETSYIVAPIAGPEVLVADAPTAPEAPGTETPATIAAAEDDAVNGTPEPGSLEATVADRVTTAAALPPTVLQADADGIKVVQAAPSAAAPVVQSNVALDAITYDPSGEVQLSGRAIGDGAVQVYLDNQPVTASPVTEGGDWQIGLPDVDTGVYTLRIDEVDSEGEVVSRIETPFKREEAEEVAAVLAEETSRDGFDVAVRTVQPGSTLWAIAEENLGAGIFYVEVFEANADLIKDPDLIYPGQIFRIPEMTQ
ncbi:LysM peptidoglycan-binding domain-containing protein [Yoonia sp. SDW83-1]|uniref:LysM peptidoglycan-binding domain-containing protein n=1 Tax=Yoonia sp. SDW83-1 TaxID=3366945 RepID=UPI00398C772C